MNKRTNQVNLNLIASGVFLTLVDNVVHFCGKDIHSTWEIISTGLVGTIAIQFVVEWVRGVGEEDEQ